MTKGLEQKIREAWDVPLYNLYCTSESLYVAVQEPGRDEMTVMDDLNMVEVLGPDNKPVSSGAEGRVIVTNLYNRTLPILRYELGDYVTRGEAHPRTFFSSIRTMRGRVDDALPVVLDNGMPDTLHPITLTEFYVAGLEKVQFVSLHPNGVRIDYVAPHDIDAAVRSEFQRLLDMKGAAHTRFEVRRVPSMRNDPQTGKHRLVRRSQAGSVRRKAREQSLDDICVEAQAHQSSDVERMLDELETLNDQEAAQRLRNLKK